jgi:hypothetical protein
MFGFGTKITQVFASPWKAATWSLGILITAYCTVPSPEQTAKQEAKVAQASAAHKSPWAKD